MITLKAFINEDDTKVAIQIPELSDKTLILTADNLEQFIGDLMDIRSRMQPPMDFGDAAPN